MGLLRTTPTPHEVEGTRIVALGIEFIYYYEIGIFSCFLLAIEREYQCTNMLSYIPNINIYLLRGILRYIWT